MPHPSRPPAHAHTHAHAWAHTEPQPLCSENAETDWRVKTSSGLTPQQLLIAVAQGKEGKRGATWGPRPDSRARHCVNEGNTVMTVRALHRGVRRTYADYGILLCARLVLHLITMPVSRDRVWRLRGDAEVRPRSAEIQAVDRNRSDRRVRQTVQRCEMSVKGAALMTRDVGNDPNYMTGREVCWKRGAGVTATT